MSLNQMKYKWMNEYNKMPLNHVRKPIKIHVRLLKLGNLKLHNSIMLKLHKQNTNMFV